MLGVVIAEGVAIVLLAVLVLGLLRSHALILKALHELGAGLELEKDAGTAMGSPAGSSAGPGPVEVELERGVVPARTGDSRAAEVVGTTLDGQERTVAVAGAGSRTLLAFLTSGCSVCQTFWEEFSAGVRDVPGGARLVVVAKGPQDESVTTLRRLAGDRLEVVQSSAAWTDYDIPGSPYFVFVEDGLITGEGSSTTWPQVRDLMAQAVSDTADARQAAGRHGPGNLGSSGAAALAAGVEDRGERDDLTRMDRELLASGVGPGHASLYQPPDGYQVPDGPAAAGEAQDHGHDHAHHDHAGH